MDALAGLCRQYWPPMPRNTSMFFWAVALRWLEVPLGKYRRARAGWPSTVATTPVRAVSSRSSLVVNFAWRRPAPADDENLANPAFSKSIQGVFGNVACPKLVHGP